MTENKNNKIYASQSFSKDKYECKQNWPPDTFCQCGGDGIVFTDKKFSIEKALSDTNEALEVIGTMAGAKSEKQHYRTAFFEVFPKNPKCFLRGEGKNVEEAELNAWNQYQKVISCQNHEFDRKGRTDGYAFCTKCPYRGTVLEPTTVCHQCNTPTCFKTNNQDQYLCMTHYFGSQNLDSIIIDYTKDQFSSFFNDYTPENQKIWFLEEKMLFDYYTATLSKVDKEIWDGITHAFNFYRGHIENQFNPLFGKKTKTELEIHEMILQAIPVLFPKIDKYLKDNNIIK